MDLSMFNLPSQTPKKEGMDFSMFNLPTQPEVQRPNQQQIQQGFQTAHQNLASSRLDISPMDVAREVPGVVGRGSLKVAETFVPAITEGFKTAGGIFGEGLAYAMSPTVRQAYEAGNLDVLPTISKTRQIDVLKKTVAVGIELAVYKNIPKAIKGTRLERAGIGALQGLGFAISEGLAKDYTPEEIVKNAAIYAPSGAGIGLLAPYLVPIIKTEITKTPQATKEAFRRMFREGTDGLQPDNLVPPREIPSQEVPTRIDATDVAETLPRSAEAPTQVSETPFVARRPPETGEQGVSLHYERVKQELGALAEDTVTYTKRNLDDIAKRSTSFIEEADPKDAFRIGMGLVEPPPGQDALGINVALSEALEKAGKLEEARMLKRFFSQQISDIASELNLAKLDLGTAGTRRIEAAVSVQRLEQIGRNLPSDLGKTTTPVKRAQQMIRREAKKGAEEVTTSIRTAYKSADELIRALTC